MLTLDYFKTHPLRVPKAQPFITIGAVRKAEATTVISPAIHPTAGAYIHYGGVELADMLTITKPALTQAELTALTHAWYNSCGIVAKQLMFYLWRIVSKELRHGNLAKCNKAFIDPKKWDPNAVILCKAISGGGDYQKHLDEHDDTNALHYIEAVEQNYRHGGWGGAFGGKKWADITQVFRWYLEGEISAMLAADRAWSLVHNTGPIFNKGFYFTLHDSNLLSVLNAQASCSVFILSDTFKHTAGYQSKLMEEFQTFTTLAVAAIQKVNPDYKAGDGGGVTSDGNPASDDLKDPTTGKPVKQKPYKFGDYQYNINSAREEA